MKRAVFAGTFDPVTNGHLDLMQRALRMFDHLTVAVAERVEKGVVFSQEERVAMTRDLVIAPGVCKLRPCHRCLNCITSVRRKRFVCQRMRPRFLVT